MSAAKKPAKKAAAKKAAPNRPPSRPAAELVPGDLIRLHGVLDADVHLVEQVKLLNHLAYVHVSTQNTSTGYRSKTMIHAAALVLLAGGNDD